MAGSTSRTASGAAAGAALLLGLCACGGAGGTDSVATARDLASAELSAVTAARTSQPGGFAADYLRRAHFTSLRVEVAYPVGRAPSQAVLDLLQERLSERCDKPDGVTVELDDAIPIEEFPEPLTDADLERIEDAHRREYSDLATKTAAMWVIFAPGHSAAEVGENGQTILGRSYRGGSSAVFPDPADQGPSLFVTTDEVVGTALVHEAGHLLGLVNRSVPMTTDHEDKKHPGHDVDPKCVMFWYVQVPRVRPNLGDPDFAQFNAACIADLRAFGGK